MLSRNVAKELPLYAAQYLRRAQIPDVGKVTDSRSMGMLLECVAYISVGSSKNSFKYLPDDTVADPRIPGF